jgi:hypothetical protein
MSIPALRVELRAALIPILVNDLLGILLTTPLTAPRGVLKLAPLIRVTPATLRKALYHKVLMVTPPAF